jgi:hypothetical protein
MTFSRVRTEWAVLGAIAVTAVAAAHDDAGQGGGTVPLPMPTYHHLHINSVNPTRSLEWYQAFWPTGRRTTVAGFPAFQGDDFYLLFTRVDKPAPGAFDRVRQRSVPQTPFWTFGSSVTDTAGLIARLTKLDPERFSFLPVYAGPDDKQGVLRSALAPHGDEMLTLKELNERARSANPAERRGDLDFGYLVDPDGMLVEFNAARTPHFWRHNHFWHERPLCMANWYVEHLGMRLGPAPVTPTGDRWPSGPASATPLKGRDRWEPCDEPVGEPSFPSFMSQGQLRSPIGVVRFENGSLTWYPRQCQRGHCGPGNDAPLSPTRGHVVDHVGLTFPDLDPLIARLKAAKVTIVRGPYAFGDGRAVLIEDPDGLGLELIDGRRP